ncbi:MAG: protein translocase subunit SecD [Gammaproteobacteria bacterium]|nr:protein translocase subunit SecD [Gammaproteobacteria bacterium]
MNKNPLWKYLLVLAVVVLGALYALPNLYGEDPAVQVSGVRNAQVTEGTMRKVEAVLKRNNVTPKSLVKDERGLLVRFSDVETQLKMQDEIKESLGDSYTVALNLAPSTPQWLAGINGKPMYLGLDLRGGVHFLMEVDMDAAILQALQRYNDQFRTHLRENKIRYLGIDVEEKEFTADGKRYVTLRFKDVETRDQAKGVLDKEYGKVVYREQEDDKYAYIIAVLGDVEAAETKKFALQQNITTLRNRVNELGVAEPVIQQQGTDRIVVQLPGVQDTARAKDILSATATLEFRLVNDEHNAAAAERGNVPLGTKLYHFRDGTPILAQNRVLLTGDYIVNAQSGIDQDSGGPAVFITLDGEGGRLMLKGTKDNVGKRMAVVFIESKTETRKVNGENKKFKRKIEEVINAATIRDRLSSRFQITGLDSTNEARDLSLLLRAGALAAPIEIVEERTVGPSLGQQNIDQGFASVIIGFCLVLVLMAVYYKGFGMVANLALALNLVLIVAILSMMQATLTLPGIAGIVLTVGMAVDANVLIFERIREELRDGATPQVAIDSGYGKAFITIADANVTTLIAALVLFALGTGPIKGFAITLSIGIITSMFTAITGTRVVANLMYGGRKVKKLSV